MDGGTDCDCDCEADDLMLAAGVSRSASGRVWRRLSARRALGAVYGSVAEALDATSADVVVDYTSAGAAKRTCGRQYGPGACGGRTKQADR
ncbi:hypothetical protein [Actinomadura madurae]|uniref:hypothetical protein n=1 Tax=Actinomadura madurae TaxID=1993 RepID=UPI0020D21011|nr:hypothetical protein [Actinomadura madurae]MCP9952205.1 hypothetical protein [Actinomadura madurae]MCP9968962.1 hypothetical protein [Actinomadura madurae]MCQ0007053.1 hypothetical protein [Actinomadura madurae]MCQ0017638.1 hypothetical protein [Actinomadura madurae]